jgi:hypothetical protein
MNVVFSSQDPLNTSVIDLETDETLLTVYTESKFMGGQTTVRRPGKIQIASSSSSSDTSGDGSAGYVAQIDWHKTRPSLVRIGRRVMPLSMFLHSEHIRGALGLWVNLSSVSNLLTTRTLACSSRTFIGPDRAQYVWKSKNNRLEVRIYSSFPCPVRNRAWAHLPRMQLYDKSEHRLIAESGSQELSLVVHEPALAFLEQVVLTFLVIRKQKKSSFKMTHSLSSDSSKLS